MLKKRTFKKNGYYVLEYIHVFTGNTVIPSASIGLTINGESKKGILEGEGPIDAVFNTILMLIKKDIELLGLDISSLTDGTKAIARATVSLRCNGIEVLGQETDPDIITASALAFIHGLNNMVKEQESNRKIKEKCLV